MQLQPKANLSDMPFWHTSPKNPTKFTCLRRSWPPRWLETHQNRHILKQLHRYDTNIVWICSVVLALLVRSKRQRTPILEVSPQNVFDCSLHNVNPSFKFHENLPKTSEYFSRYTKNTG